MGQSAMFYSILVYRVVWQRMLSGQPMIKGISVCRYNMLCSNGSGINSQLIAVAGWVRKQILTIREIIIIQILALS